MFKTGILFPEIILKLSPTYDYLSRQLYIISQLPVNPVNKRLFRSNLVSNKNQLHAVNLKLAF